MLPKTLEARACRESESMIRDSNLVAIFLEKPREKVDLNHFFVIRIKNDSNHLIRESKIHKCLFNKDSRIKKDLRIIDGSNQDSNQFLN